jgi:hypothetical protein
MEGTVMSRTGFLSGLVAVLLVSQASGAGISSTFDNDDDGWKIQDLFDGASGAKDWMFAWIDSDPSYIQFDEPQGMQNANWQWFGAPAPFLGDQSGFVGGKLSFSLKNAGQVPFDYPVAYVILATNATIPEGQQDAGKPFYLHYTDDSEHAQGPGGDWTAYTVPLVAGSGFGRWYYAPFDATPSSTTPPGPLPSISKSPHRYATSTYLLADDTLISLALGNLTGLYINADFRTGSETTGLDSVELREYEANPVP